VIPISEAQRPAISEVPHEDRTTAACLCLLCELERRDEDAPLINDISNRVERDRHELVLPNREK
jgi:hypothetical protein